MSVAAARDRLSYLSDDLLTHILSFAPTREAASTTALSRRWRRPLWLATAAVNLDYRSYTSTTAGDHLRWRAMDDADHAFAFRRSNGCRPKKLNVLMRDDATTHRDLLRCAPPAVERVEDSEEEEQDAVGFEEEDHAGIVNGEEDDAGGEPEREEKGKHEDTAPVEEGAGSIVEEDSGNGIEELRMEWLDHGCPCITRTHAISSLSLPYATLRVLELTGCMLQPQSDSDRRRRVTFPFLEALRLRRCRAELTTLQDMISAAPRLADVRLEAVLFLDEHDVYRLRCPAATVVVMANCGEHLLNGLYNACCSVKLNAPRLRRFHYVQAAGHFSDDTSFSLESPTTLPLDHVHLALPSTPAINLRHSLLSAVRHTSLLRLTVFSLSDLDDGYMPMLFSRLERLEIQELSGWCALDHAAAVVGVVDLLSSCPCLRELRLKFIWRKYVRENNADPADVMAAIADFSPCRSMDDEEAEAADCCNDLEDDLQGRLSRRCRLDCLRRVVVEFDAEELTCFQVRLLKFLAREAGTLEEVVVDGGKGYDSSHIDRKVARWRRKQRPRPVSPPPPPAFSEFPPLEAPPCSDGEVDDGDNTKAPEVPVCSYTAPEVHSYYYRVACDYDRPDGGEERVVVVAVDIILHLGEKETSLQGLSLRCHCQWLPLRQCSACSGCSAMHLLLLHGGHCLSMVALLLRQVVFR
ncbi:hypothetical protein QYE76_060267 [Lolium multiflorum]|uniref:F-box domain-containing protein n=1 Tax=Lolium multiflorum TaxID=4521 RepID=A0AAD8S1U9_LOLMU|nr:hypothetical protein QYE76_060267 [Lolium multiflorum]